MTSTTTAVAPAASATKRVAAPGFDVSFVPADFRVGHMRRITRAYLRCHGMADLIDSALLAVSELVTNAIRHGGSRPVGLRVAPFADALRIEVTDGSSTRARARAAAADDESGRGLLLVSAVSKEWGVSDDGRTTWCSLATTERSS
ncbi:ATP-binding protein [Streptomyces luteolifulvus]|jgi:anti-sigma regulatory factor (Ser/Thr protein kinase)|uniref:ATP-binding protein n=1 Tax=Streptomyces luteolifulvus TaxID=2615112 RepID=A0A6H9UR97_9ACTN|nr:ATP-binding protein [Streptomyces luteolifulvus]KAB1140228.1 ATP-binding protein [Streptomyces luteolifulvus]